ncbi:YqjF family protein [Ferruginibacter sp. HRS2-29]|uniref:YqjF family protein n=1 Tax=Ferruginibacter sp. HRS2-29 TaxID=2487334 RepID=UPI0020CEECBC|nr:DUF2071 domain-containing protein [Ferruginibacter sp. HRS2-29]MCP9751408.1 DUF2071 domain-containing protein [Ferruginibacter sp. HRS2-29]
MARSFLEAEWNNLIMANYAIDPALLLPYLPHKTELDTFNGKVYVSLVGFMFEKTKMLGFRIPFHINFEEVNLRFYVRFKDDGEWKRGVVFIKEIVPRIAISVVANVVYKEKYVYMPMSHFLRLDNDEQTIGYAWKYRGRWNRLEAITAKQSVPMKPGSEEEFIAEHYWGYSRHSANITYEYAVQHPAWEIYPVKNYTIDCDFATLYGNAFGFLTNAEPTSVFIAKGSRVAVLSKRTL